MSKNDGGLAFPGTRTEKVADAGYGIGDQWAEFSHPGMTLRDYFAAKAMQGMLGGQWPDSMDRPEIAKRAYLMADAMLAEREKA